MTDLHREVRQVVEILTDNPAVRKQAVKNLMGIMENTTINWKAMEKFASDWESGRCKPECDKCDENFPQQECDGEDYTFPLFVAYLKATKSEWFKGEA